MKLYQCIPTFIKTWNKKNAKVELTRNVTNNNEKVKIKEL